MQESVLKNLKELCQVLEQRSETTVMRKKFLIEKGRKNYKVVAQEETAGGKVITRHAHCFVDINNGEVYKAASWSSPAKGARFDLLDPDSYSLAIRVADPYGGYLYRRG